VCVVGNPRWNGLSKQTTTYPHLIRWFALCSSQPQFAAASASLSARPANAHAKATDEGSWDIGVDASFHGRVVTRFPPEPSGYLHIGHAKAALINNEIAQRYAGKMLVRFDDTNPSKEKGEYEEAIIEDLKRLNITPSSVSHTSDHFAAILRLQTRMLEEDLAYVDPSPQEEQKKERMAKQENKYRSQPVAENLRLWGEMQKASEEGLKCCVRQRGHTALARS
jgi:glutamyl-tRNA synthetase